MKLCVLSACYERPEMAAVLRESCEFFHVPLVFCEAKELNGLWSGDLRVSKMVAAYEALDGLLANGYTYALWIDGFDAFLARPEVWIRVALRQMRYPPMVFSGEKNCWPSPELADAYPVGDSPWRFINAGTWIAQIRYLRDALLNCIRRFTNEPQDQLIWSTCFLCGYLPGAVIDTQRLIFQTMWGTEPEELTGHSCVIHYNGGDPATKYAQVREHWESVKRGVVL